MGKGSRAKRNLDRPSQVCSEKVFPPMAVDHIRYDLLTQDALRGVVRQVLTDAAKTGLPGDHHFYISFYTQAEGVKISAQLRKQYPEEITIILQHRYFNLVVREDHFE